MEKYTETLAAITRAKADITKSEAAWLSFLNTSARMYKHPFDYQVRINSVRPEATACADFNTWTADSKLNRHIKKGARGIPVIDTTAENAARVYLFDVSDTDERSSGLSKKPFVWSANESHYEAIRDGISYRYGFTAINAEGAIREIAEMVAENTAEKCYNELSTLGSELPKDEVEQLICGSVSHVLLTRCGLPTENNPYNMRSITAIKGAKAAETFGRILTSETSVILRQIEAIVKGREAELRKERNRNEDERNADSGRDTSSAEYGERGVLPRYENGTRDDVHSRREGGEISILPRERSGAFSAGGNAADESRADERGDTLGEANTTAAGAGRVYGSGDRPPAVGGADEVREAGQVYEAERTRSDEREIRGASQEISGAVSAEAVGGNDDGRELERSLVGNSDERGAADGEDNRAVGEARGQSDGATESGEPNAVAVSDERLSGAGGGDLHSGDGLRRGTDERDERSISITAGAEASAVSVPENGIIGNYPFRYIPHKTYRKLDTETALQIAAVLQRDGVNYSGNVKKASTTLTVSAENAPLVDKMIYDMQEDKSAVADITVDGGRWYLTDKDGEPLKYYNRKRTPLNEVELNFAATHSLERIEANSREFLKETAKANPKEAVYIRAHIEELTERIVTAHIQLGLYAPETPLTEEKSRKPKAETKAPATVKSETTQTLDVEIENIRAFRPVSPDEPQLYLIANNDYSAEIRDLAYIHGEKGKRTVEYLHNVSEPVREHIERLAERLPNRFTMPAPAVPRSGEPMVTIGFSEHSDIPDEPVTMPFSQANAILGYLDMEQHNTREDKEIGSGWYHKTDFTITYALDGDEHTYEGRYDLGDGEGSLLAHVKDFLEYYKKPEYRAIAEQEGEKAVEEYEQSLKSGEKLLELLDRYVFAEKIPQERESEVIPDKAGEQISLFDVSDSLPQDKPVSQKSESEIAHEALEKQKSVDELTVGDVIKYDGETWRITNIDGDLMLDLENTDKNADQTEISLVGNWKFSLTQDGFEHVAPRLKVEENENTPTEAAPEIPENIAAEKEEQAVELPPKSPLANFVISDENLGAGGAKAKYKANVEAIKLLKALEADGRAADSEEQEILSRYVGWGGIPQAFDGSSGDWASEYAELNALLNPAEYESARASTLNAHYTSPTVIGAIYEGLANLGFKSGNVLEPAMGVGNFFGAMPQDMTSSSKLYGVELDDISGRIAKQLYPNADIQITGYETTAFPDGFFDAAVGNVPFGGYKLNEPRYNKLNLNIHDHFFVKSLDKVREGGVIAFVTSKGTLDKANPAVRKYLAQRAELLGAIRLPNTAFKANAGTEVTSDIIFLQKRERPLDIEPDWVHLGKTDDGLPLNQYFIDHPEMVLGKIVQGNKLYGRGGDDTMCVPFEGADLKEQLKQAITNIQGQIPEAEISAEQREKPRDEKSVTADPNVKNFSYTVVDDKVYFRENGEMILQELPEGAAERIKGLVDIRDCVRALIDLQLNEFGESDIAAQQAKLNKIYDSFVKRNGRINSVANKRAFKNDDSFYLLASLEVLDDNGEFQRKADMFSKRTIKQYKEITRADTAAEALAVSVSEKARVDLPFMSRLCGKSEAEIISDLQGVIFRVPFSDENGVPRYETADEYLSGNIREKLKLAEQAENLIGGFEVNVSELKRVMPEPLKAADIEMRLGSTLIPPDDITRFMIDVLKTPLFAAEKMKVEYSPFTSEWHIDSKRSDTNNILANVKYGTTRRTAYELIEDSLNLRDTRVYDRVETPDGKEKSVLNQKETELAQQKQTDIKEAFKDWIFKDPKRRERLVNVYNERFNSVRPREYDGSYLTFPGMSPEVSLRQHQLNAIAHTLYGGNTLLAHAVGAGKTFEMIASAMRGKQLGLHHKAMFCVPNHLTEQIGSDFMRLYPSANVLVATEQDFTPQNRKRLCAKIATGDYDAVIIGHSQLEKIPISPERQEMMIGQQIEEISWNIQNMNPDNKFNIKQLEKTKKNLQARLQSLLEMKRDDVVTFEELGVDKLYVDEAQNFKNLFLYTKMRNVAGLQQSEAQKSSDLYMKCQYLDELTGGRGTVFATGTPVSNSMVELYTMMRYLQSHTLSEMQLQHFDAWAANFGESVTAMELAPEGNAFRMKTRFSKFFNLPELMNIFKEAADIKTADMLNLPVPEAHFHNVVVEPTPEQAELVKGLSARATAIHNKQVSPHEDNMLKITSDGRKIGLDQRLINPLLPDAPQSKVNACIDNVFDIYTRTEDRRSAQIIFCDFSTPNGKGFNLYDDIRDKLVARGVPKSEVAFIHEATTEAKKKELFAKVRSGQVRVLIGSTAKCGAGTNVQDKLVALHHLDCPWRPADLEQREGRIIRQGNENAELGGVDIYRYVTNATFDAYLYQTIENKQKFISQIMTSKSPARSCEDADETTLSYAEVKALCAGNPLIKEKMELDVEVTRLKTAKAAYNNERYALEDKIISELPLKIKQAEGRLKGLTADNAFLKAQPPAPEEGIASMTVCGQTYTNREEAGEALIAAAQSLKAGEKEKIVGSYRGFDIRVSFNSFSKQFELTLSREMGYVCELGKSAGNVTRVDNALNKIEQYMESERKNIAGYREQLEISKAEYKIPFAHEEELEEKQARLNEVNAALAELEREPTVDGEEKSAPDERRSVEKNSPPANGKKPPKEFKPNKPAKKPSILKQIAEIQAEQRARESGNDPENSRDNLDVG
ncbi:MAG: hypothetical protein NC452_05745 [Eubacterium sp.]|nr:hypothetical protein [Eubacterium sp.]